MINGADLPRVAVIDGVRPRSASTDAVESGALWGLGVAELHEAYWRAKGIQVVRRGVPGALQEEAELYLLVEPGQLVLFDLEEITADMTWNGASVVRLRLVESESERYSERIVVGDGGRVEAIRRVYKPRSPSSYRVVLTRQREHAETWHGSQRRRLAWASIRRSLPYFRIDHRRTAGRCWNESLNAGGREFVSELVRRWENPDRVLTGITEHRPGVWAPHDAELADEAVIVRPVWIGAGVNVRSEAVLIGPKWLDDSLTTDPASEAAVTMRNIIDIQPANDRDELPAPPDGRRLFHAAKRLIDIAVSLTALVVFAPFIALFCLAIAIEDGFPVFYPHLRQTLGGREFRCWKFRTMRRDADLLRGQLAALNVCDGPQFYIRDDPRVTRVGRLLRRCHLDEVPQLWNVLRGEMSLVGPRPSPESENQFCPAWRELRLSVRPGITGLWQVERTREPGRDFQEWIQFDVDYVRTANLWLDFRICAKTILKMLPGRRSA